MYMYNICRHDLGEKTKSSIILGCCGKYKTIEIIKHRESRWVISSVLLFYICYNQQERSGEISYIFLKISKSSTLLGCCSKYEIIQIIKRRESRGVISSLCLSQPRERFRESSSSFAKRTSQRTILTYNICIEEIKSFHVQFLYHVSVQCIYSS